MPAIKLRLDNISKVFLGTAVVLTILSGAELVYWTGQLPPLVPLYYSLPWGVDRLVAPLWLMSLPAAAVAVIIVNFIGSFMLREIVLTRILSSTALLVSLLALITLTKIIFLGLP